MKNEEFLTKQHIKTYLPKREKDSHKGTFGNILNIAGSINYKGAAFLSTKSALKCGAGFIALCAIKEVIDTVSTICPEAVFIPLEEKFGTISQKEYKKILEIIPKYKVISIGCGLSSINQNQKEIENFIKNLFSKLQTLETPIIIDADGLNIISKLRIQKLPPKSILTPHPMELSRLLSVEVNKIQEKRAYYAKMAAQKFNSIVVLKGNQTVISNGDKTFINTTGNSALAKAGEGDVLTGMISGFCAQNTNMFESACLGVYLHGLAGEFASEKLSEYGVNASDVIEFIPLAIKSINF